MRNDNYKRAIKLLLHEDNQQLLDEGKINDLYENLYGDLESGLDDEIIPSITQVLLNVLKWDVPELLKHLTFIPDCFLYKVSDIELGELVIPSNITAIGSSAFQKCSTLTGVVIPNSVTDIDYSAFENCVKLKKVVLGNRVTFLSPATFNYCESLEEIDIPDSVDTICDYAFGGCNSLKEITIPESVTSMGMGVFDGCTSLKKIYCVAESSQPESWHNKWLGDCSAEIVWGA